MDDKTIANFWKKVNREGPTLVPELGPCWVWTASRGKDGYGFFGVHRKITKAHRVAFYLEHGRWPEPCALHRCDGGIIGCVRASHLFEGTIADNVADMVAKGRARGGTCPRERRRRGESHHKTHLVPLDVVSIREARESGDSLAAIGSRFGITKQAVRAICLRKAWAHVP
jgi:hypothetical protein